MAQKCNCFHFMYGIRKFVKDSPNLKVFHYDTPKLIPESFLADWKCPISHSHVNFSYLGL